MPRPKGFTTIELMMVIVVVSLVSLVTLPKFQDALGQNTLHGTRSRVMARFAAARSAAMTSGRVVYLHVHGNQLYVTAKTGGATQDTITPVENLYTQYGVSMTPVGADSVRIDPTGIGGTAATVLLAKGSRTDTVKISKYGRVTK